jgi:hypothetical protein
VTPTFNVCPRRVPQWRGRATASLAHAGASCFTASRPSMAREALAALRPPAAPPGGRARARSGARGAFRRICPVLPSKPPCASTGDDACHGSPFARAKGMTPPITQDKNRPSAWSASSPRLAPGGLYADADVSDRRGTVVLDRWMARGGRFPGAGLAGKRRQDAEAQPAWSDRRAGGHRSAKRIGRVGSVRATGTGHPEPASPTTRPEPALRKASRSAARTTRGGSRR